ncbi:MAG: acyl carrier protein [Candidatus Dadabacteria bacterium]|nr:acyl carrier protein [Candidatus Dadabacteria bacterium]
MSEEIKDRVKKVLIKKLLHEFTQEGLNDDASLIELGVGVDSVATLELVVALEEEFKISIDEGEINQELLATVNSISEYISKQVGLKAVNQEGELA